MPRPPRSRFGSRQRRPPGVPCPADARIQARGPRPRRLLASHLQGCPCSLLGYPTPGLPLRGPTPMIQCKRWACVHGENDRMLVQWFNRRHHRFGRAEVSGSDPDNSLFDIFYPAAEITRAREGKFRENQRAAVLQNLLGDKHQRHVPGRYLKARFLVTKEGNGARQVVVSVRQIHENKQQVQKTRSEAR